MDRLSGEILTDAQLEALAYEYKFIQRQRGKITAKNFLEVLVFNGNDLKHRSLNDMANEYHLNHKVEITKQSLDERMNKRAVAFLKGVVLAVIKKQIEQGEWDVRSVKRLLIKDSTGFQLDESLSESYPGSGGSGSKASIRFQFEFDYLRGEITDLSLHPFNYQDTKDALETLDKISEGDLIIRDLGYVSLVALEGIMGKGAFHLSRLNPSLQVYEKKGDTYCLIDFSSLLKKMSAQGLSYLDQDVYIGQRKLKQRMVLYLLPEEIYQKRIRAKNRIQAKKKRSQRISEAIKARLHFNIFITNMNKDQISAEKIWSLYRLRWQIEIIFKIWKSILSLDKVKKVKKERLDVYFYSRLLLIVLGWKIISAISHWLYRYEKKTLSLFKSYKLVFFELVRSGAKLLTEKDALKKFLLDFYETSRKRNLLERRGHDPSSFELFLGLGI